MTRYVVAAAALAAMIAMTAAHADEYGELNPEEGGIRHLDEDMRLHPDRIGILCQAAYETQKGGNHAEATAAMRTCAESGNAPSMILLAHAYENGLGAPRDLAQATAWLHRAAMTGYSLAEYHYAVALRTGSGVPADPTAARFWLERAAEHGCDDARALLAEDYES